MPGGKFHTENQLVLLETSLTTAGSGVCLGQSVCPGLQAAADRRVQGCKSGVSWGALKPGRRGWGNGVV